MINNYDLSKKTQINIIQMLNHIKESLILIDTDFRIIFMNNACAGRLNLLSNNVSGKNLMDLLPEDTVEDREKYLKKVLELKKPVEFEDTRGVYRFQIKYYPVFNDEKDINSIVIMAIDFTKKENEEDCLKKNQLLEEEIQEKTQQLVETNTALKVLLKQRDEEKHDIEEQIYSNFKMLVLPVIDNLKESFSDSQQLKLIDILEEQLREIILPFSKKLSDPMINLTPTEIKIAGLIKSGKTNKEIAEVLNSSVHTISRHRENIRKKTGLTNQKTNLRTFLASL